MTISLANIQRSLEQAKQPNSMRDLFCQILNWGKATGAGQTIQLGAPLNQTLTAKPVAQLGALPVFRIDWPDTTLPNVTQRRAVHHKLSQIAFEHLICYITSDGKRLAFVWARDRGGKRAELRTLPYEVGAHARTTIERLGALFFRFDEFDMFGNVSATLVADRLNAAFDVEAVTREFFTQYREAFQAAEQSIKGVSGEGRRLFTQKLFNRLMFIVFLERKGWLTFNGHTDYLRALWQAHLLERKTDPKANFYIDRLKLLFFAGLNTPHEVNVVDINRGGVLANRIGQVPYLNGGLFEEEGDDKNDAIVVPDDALDAALTDLFYRFNFTVSESTPLDIEVAVDPEMLGKVFEELVTGRHESGSYYTPRPIVAFMCREGLKGYLTAKLPKETPDVIARFVDERGAAELRDPEATLAALKSVRVCDPACGSGAYLLGMLQELLSLRAGLFAAKRVDATTTYQRKLEIIQNNIYGVDLDPFAINIARLRLWLSLVVDYEGDNPPPLPNLDFKVEAGDSLQAPDPSGGDQIDWVRQQQVDDYVQLKEQFLRSHHGEKQTLKKQVEAKKHEIAAFTHPRGGVAGFDWEVEFAEVFANGGFDIVVANPPYVRMELFKEIKPVLRANFPEVHSDRADLYCYFYGRAVQMLRVSGMLVFISPNKWFRAAYGARLREHIAATCRVSSITDFGDLPVFQTALTYPMIFIAQKGKGFESSPLPVFTEVRSLDLPYPDVLALTQEQGQELLPSAISGSSWMLTSSSSSNIVQRMQDSGVTLNKYVDGKIYWGVKTGLNAAFVIDGHTRSQLALRDGIIPRNWRELVWDDPDQASDTI
jgi:methylase of polypeptide subunit release factors